MDVSSLIHRFGATGAAEAASLAAVCLVQYLLHLYNARRTRRESQDMRRRLEVFVDRVSTLEADRSLAETENRSLRRLAETSSADEAVEVLLEHCAPDPDAGFAAYFEMSPEGEPRLRSSRGLSADSRQYIAVDPDWLVRLSSEAVIHLAQKETRRTAFFSRLSTGDQERLSRLILFRVGTAVHPSGLLVASDLPPVQSALDARIDLVQRLLATLGSFLHRSQAIERQQDELRVTRELLELRCLVDTHLGSPVELLEEFLERVATATGFERATLYLASGQRLDAKPLVCVGTALPRAIADLWRLDEAALARRGLHSSGSLQFYNAADLHALRVRSTMCGAFVTALNHDDSLIGVVCLARQADAALSAGDRELLRWATDYLRETILRTVDRAMIELQARRDALTQLANRHSFDREIRKQVDLAVQSGSDCSLIMLDVDRFKSLNDRYGHLAGDEVLRTIARTIESCVSRMRSTDRPMVARFGGEELAVLLPGVPIQGAKRVAEQIVQAVRSTDIEFDGHVICPTISGGIACCPKDGRNPEELIAAADGALYRAKEGGRDRWECAGEERPDTLRIAAIGS